MRDVLLFYQTEMYQTEKIENGLIFYTRYYGTFTLDLFMESSVKRTDDIDYDNATFIVIDVQQAVLSQLKQDDGYMMLLRTREEKKQRPHMLFIIVAADPFSYGMSRMWHGAAKQECNDVYVVRSEEQAMELIDRIRLQRNI